MMRRKNNVVNANLSVKLANFQEIIVNHVMNKIIKPL